MNFFNSFNSSHIDFLRPSQICRCIFLFKDKSVYVYIVERTEIHFWTKSGRISCINIGLGWSIIDLLRCSYLSSLDLKYLTKKIQFDSPETKEEGLNMLWGTISGRYLSQPRRHKHLLHLLPSYHQTNMFTVSLSSILEKSLHGI